MHVALAHEIAHGADAHALRLRRHPEREIERVGASHKYVCSEAYRNEEEKVNLLYWQLTCRMFCTPEEWQWWFKSTGYTGDHSFIYFE